MLPPPEVKLASFEGKWPDVIHPSHAISLPPTLALPV